MTKPFVKVAVATVLVLLFLTGMVSVSVCAVLENDAIESW